MFTVPAKLTFAIYWLLATMGMAPPDSDAERPTDANTTTAVYPIESAASYNGKKTISNGF